jgi:hypothetical protein
MDGSITRTVPSDRRREANTNKAPYVVIFDDNEFHYHEAQSYRIAYKKAVSELDKMLAHKASIRRVKGDIQDERKVVYMPTYCMHPMIGHDGYCRRCGKNLR